MNVGSHSDQLPPQLLPRIGYSANL